MVESKSKKKHKVRNVLPRRPFSRPQLIIYLLVFAGIGYLIFRTFAAGSISKTWDAQADFQAGSLSSTVANTDGTVTLQKQTTSTSNLPHPADYTVDFETPGNYSEGPGQGMRPGFKCTTTDPNVGPPDTSAKGYTQPISQAWQFDNSTKRHGNYSIKLNSPYEARTIYSCGKNAIDMLLDNFEVGGQEAWHAWSFKLPTDWQGSNGWGTMVEWIANAHFWPSCGILSFDISNPNALRVIFHTGYTDYNSPCPSRYNKAYSILGNAPSDNPTGSNPPALPKGVWVDLVVHVTWVSGKNSSNPNGIFEVWYRAEGQSNFTKIYSDVPGGGATVQTSPHPTTIYNTLYGEPGDQRSNPNDRGMGTEWGTYSNLTSWTRNYWLDNIRRRATSSAIMQDFGGGTLPGDNSTVATNTYPSSGSIILTHDAGQTVDWASSTPVETKPAGTNITYSYQTSPDNINWSAATNDITGLANSRYLRVMATLTTSNNTVTPTLDKLTVAYDPISSITTPTIIQDIVAGQTLSGTVTWTATVTSGASDIAKMDFAMDGNTNNTTVNAPGPYQRVLDTTKLTNGTHGLGLTVYLTDGTKVWQPYQIGDVTVSNSTTSKTGDINNDGSVNIQDLSILLSNYGKTGTGDINNDGTVNIVDLSILMTNYGK